MSKEDNTNKIPYPDERQYITAPMTQRDRHEAGLLYRFIRSPEGSRLLREFIERDRLRYQNNAINANNIQIDKTGTKGGKKRRTVRQRKMQKSRKQNTSRKYRK